MSNLTASKLHRAAQCPASCALPGADRRNPDSDRGRAIHSYLEDVTLFGPEEALARVPTEYSAACDAIDLGGLPVGVGYSPELALAYDVELGTVRVLGMGIARNYGTLSASEVAMSLDVAAVAEDDEVQVWDYKTGAGHDRVGPPTAAENPQLHVAALALAAVYGKKKARVALIHLREDGTHYEDSATLDELDLELFAVELRSIHRRVEFARREVGAGKIPDVREGSWCRYCPAFAACPAKAALAMTLGQEPASLAADIKRYLTPTGAAKARAKLKEAKRVLAEVERAIHAYAEETGGFEVAPGVVFGPHETTEEVLDGMATFDALEAAFGVDVAREAVSMKASKASIERALRGVWEARRAAGEKTTLKGLKDEALESIRAAGGVTVKTTVEIGEHRVGEPAPMPIPVVPVVANRQLESGRVMSLTDE